MKINHFAGFVGEVMEKNPIVVSPSDRVSHARRLILDKNVGRLPVIENGKLVGIIAEDDIAFAMRSFRDLVADNQQDSRIRNLLVGDIMTRSVVSVYTNTPLAEAVQIKNLIKALNQIIKRKKIIKRRPVLLRQAFFNF